MLLTKQQRIEIILMSGSSRKIAEEFNRKHRTSITHDTGKITFQHIYSKMVPRPIVVFKGDNT